MRNTYLEYSEWLMNNDGTREEYDEYFKNYANYDLPKLFDRHKDEGTDIICSGYVDNINWSEIKDKLIRLAAKYTDSYASDILIDITSVENNLTPQSRMFGFRENGVDHNSYVACAYKNYSQSLYCYRSIWKLDITTDGSGRCEMKFYEVRLRYNV